MAFQFFDALAGAGKTHALAQYVERLAIAGERVLFVQPSKQLIDATIRDELGGDHIGFTVKVVHGGTTAHVVSDIIQAIRSDDVRSGRVLFITHEAFMRLPYIENRSEWHLVFDEVPTVDVCEQFAIPDTHNIITSALQFDPYDAEYGIISANPSATVSVSRIASNFHGDEIWGRFGGLARRILSDHWDVFARQSCYQGLVSGQRAVRKLTTHSVLKPTVFAGFKQVIIASALFTESTLYKVWGAQGVDFKSVNQNMRDRLRYQKHENGSLITIRHVTASDWSKTLRDKRISYGGRDTSLRELLPALVGNCLARIIHQIDDLGLADVA